MFDIAGFSRGKNDNYGNATFEIEVWRSGDSLLSRKFNYHIWRLALAQYSSKDVRMFAPDCTSGEQVLLHHNDILHAHQNSYFLTIFLYIIFIVARTDAHTITTFPQRIHNLPQVYDV
jgi:hypothetical protein